MNISTPIMNYKSLIFPHAVFVNAYCNLISCLKPSAFLIKKNSRIITLYFIFYRLSSTI